MQPILGEIVRYHRRRAGLTRAELARLASVGKTVLFDLEHGRRTVRLDSIMKVLDALHISLDWHSPLKEQYLAHERAGDRDR